ncbi:MAG: protein kinase domain-containing protein [Myxococcota bacterium]
MNAPEPLRPGTVFHEQYEIVRCIGFGGMGVVYEALHLPTRRRRALKTLLPRLLTDAEARARFRLEAVVAADVDSEHIVEVLDAGIDAATGMPFLVMELLRGENLAELLRQRGRLPSSEVIALLAQVTSTLDRLHASGIVHRDLKPENLFLAQREGAKPRIKLLDFGVAKVVAESSIANTTRSLGTPAYMSPEQIRGDGDIGPSADLYALAQIAFTLLVGSSYWEPETRGAGVYSLLVKIMESVAEPARARAAQRGVYDLPPAFDEWFARATARDSLERFASAAELVRELARALAVQLSATPAPWPAARPSPKPNVARAADAASATAATLEAVAVGSASAGQSKVGRKAAAASSVNTGANRSKLRIGWLLIVAGTATAFLARLYQAGTARTNEPAAPAVASLNRSSSGVASTTASSTPVLAAAPVTVTDSSVSSPVANPPAATLPPALGSAAARPEPRATTKPQAGRPKPGTSHPPARGAAEPVDPTDIR